MVKRFSFCTQPAFEREMHIDFVYKKGSRPAQMYRAAADGKRELMILKSSE